MYIRDRPWTYTYTIAKPTWSAPTAGSSNVACASAALVAPTAPQVRDNCGRIIPVTAGQVVYDTLCGGTVVYNFTYTGCDGTTQPWTYTYTIAKPTWSAPTAGSSNVACASAALVAPTAPQVRDNCGRIIPVTAGQVVYDTLCGGTVVYNFTYTGCDGTTQPWTCLLYTSDAADERSSVDLCGRRFTKKTMVA